MLVARQRERDLGVGHRQALAGIGRVADLGAWLLEKLEPRRRRVEQVANHDPGAAGECRRAHQPLGATLDRERVGRAPAARSAGDLEPADRGDRRQRLAAKAERRDAKQIVAGELGGGVALDREREFVGRHAVAVIGDRYQRPPAVVHDHVDVPGAGVDGVLHQLLDHGGGALDHLARRDAVDDGLGKQPDGHGSASGREAARYCRVSTLPSSTAG